MKWMAKHGLMRWLMPYMLIMSIFMFAMWVNQIRQDKEWVSFDLEMGELEDRYQELLKDLEKEIDDAAFGLDTAQKWKNKTVEAKAEVNDEINRIGKL